MPKLKPRPIKPRLSQEDLKRRREYRECKSKMKFNTMPEASAHIEQYHSKDITIAVYRCCVCGLLHVGHPRRGKAKILDRKESQ
jgi:hypothetical protein